MPIRPYRPEDLDALYVINQESTPGVGSEDNAAGLQRWIDISICLVATDNSDTPLGFITLIEPGTKAYDGANLRWFERYLEDFATRLIYVDRIGVASLARGSGTGAALYGAAFRQFADYDEIGCEINLLPPNPGSHRFHKRLGFFQIGERYYDQARKSVAYYIRRLD